MPQRPSPRLRRTPRPSSANTGARRPRALAGSAALLLVLAVALVVGGGVDDRRSDDVGSPTAATGAVRGASPSGDTAAEDRGAVDSPVAVLSATTVVGSGDEASAKATGTASGAGGSAPDVGTVQLPGRPAQPRIVRTGSLQVEVGAGGFADASTALTRIATGLGGFVSASEISSFEDDPRGTITLRVPADQFDEALAEIGELGSVEALTTASQDVTGEHTDVASRLEALEAERDQIERVLTRAETIPDILSVRDRLAAVQSEIEQHQGRLKVLDDQTALSTVTVALTEPGSPSTLVGTDPERRGFSELWHDSSRRFTAGGRSIALGLATMAPWLLLALALWLPSRSLWRRLSPPAPPPPAPAG